ncbi:MAG: hypothetical protein P3W97_003985 [Tepidimonas sp.]|uniref:hypothetical protein n=1 Tax=Tepidimonas sp. TaxID=2002775 RepID=UPI00259E92F2|nr:hypothetical protein [Tepidimonas sp.]MDM7456418.1 hypothetical protein [Tepidimonas sp.]
MIHAPLLREALWRALRPLTWGWGSVLAIQALLLAALMWWAPQQTQQLQLLQGQRDTVAAQLSQARQDHDLALEYRIPYAEWQREGLISDEPLATWRALQMQKILDWLGTQPDWLQQAVELELGPAQPWSAAQDPAAALPAPLEPAAPGEAQPATAQPSAQTLRLRGRHMHDIEAWGVVQAIQRLLGSSAALQQCQFTTDRSRADGGAAQPSADAALPNLEWECQWTLFFIPRAAPAAAPAVQP